MENDDINDDIFDIFLPPPPADAFLLTLDGKMIKGITSNESDLLENADAIQELMIDIMKEEQAQSGLWRWKIFDNWNSIEGWEY